MRWNIYNVFEVLQAYTFSNGRATHINGLSVIQTFYNFNIDQLLIVGYIFGFT